MELTVIGCSGSFAGPHSPASCYVVSGDDAEGRTWRLVLDMGSGALGSIQRHLPLPAIDGILVSHLHPDHCIDLAGLHIAVRWDPRGWPRGPIPMYSPAGSHAYLAHPHGIGLDPGLTGSFEFHDWQEREAVEIGPFTVEAFRVVHPVPDPYAIRVVHHGPAGDTVLAYSGDSDACDALVEAARDADVFLCEAAYMEGRDDALRGIHLTGLRAGEVASRAGARRLMLTHLPIWNDPVQAEEEARRAYPGPVLMAQADHRYPIPGAGEPDRTITPARVRVDP
ncbi:MBL fold metallo-hydrolase [Rothia halotolerans]|uniref:MBL fold metallo-hydrolase n=1 Tax=Rothia halotolerans TaxID=405770 RepID=UPI00101BD533|nr:MBL fold metallo-hydrolase [Rothia halotolerans]